MLTNLLFLGGVVWGLAMSSALWFGLTVLWEAVSTPDSGNTEALSVAQRSAIGAALVVVALAPVYVMIRDEAWSLLYGYAAATLGVPLLALIEAAREKK